MSSESVEKNESESKLMNDNERDKTYGTDGTVVITTDPIPSKNEGNDSEKGQNRRTDKNIVQKLRQISATDSHINFIDRFVSIVFDTSIESIECLFSVINYVFSLNSRRNCRPFYRKLHSNRLHNNRYNRKHF